MTIAVQDFQDSRLARLVRDIAEGHRILWLSVLGMTIGLVVCLALIGVDHRLLNGVDVWDKPAKFFLSLVVQLATVSWALTQLPEQARRSKGIDRAVWVMSLWAWAELAYLVFRAARGEASHFNFTSTISTIAYGVMGFGAVSITASGGFVGLHLWQQRKLGLWTEAAGLGLLVGMVLGTLAGGYVSAQAGHWVGGELSDAHGVGFFAWSSSGGDLRIAHFVGLHAAQVIPFAALSGSRKIVYATALSCVVLTAGVFALAVAGLPLFAA
jgi:hypothetical protein